MSSNPNPYESQQVEEIRSWKTEEPGVVGKAVGFVTAPVAWLVNKLIPDAAIEGVLSGASKAAEALADEGDVLRDTKANRIEDISLLPLEACDAVANSVHNWAVGIGIGMGGGTGSIGLPGLIADMPLTITLALRTIHKCGLCYGFRCTSDEDTQFALGIPSASGANTVAEKAAALATLRSVQVAIANQTWKAMTEKAVESTLSREAGVIGIRSLAKQLGVNLTKRKALQAIPVIGAAVGASATGWYVKEVGWAARRSFQERLLIKKRILSGPI